jgi:hypothetical protein
VGGEWTLAGPAIRTTQPQPPENSGIKVMRKHRRNERQREYG